jgi:hypothetical protein
MVYEEQPGRQIYLTLPLPNVQTLAQSISEPPPDDIRDEIVEVALANLEQAPDGPIDPYRLHADVLQTSPSVTIGEVAWVLLASFPGSR